MSNVVLPSEKAPSQPPLRLGVVLDSFQVPAWTWYALRELSKCDTIQLCLVAIAKKEVPISNRQPVLFRLWTALDRWAHHPVPDATKIQDCRPLIGSSSLTPVPLLTLDGELSSDIESLRTCDLDLLLNLGHSYLHPELSTLAHLGTWSLRESDEGDPTGIPSQFWDMFDGKRVFTHGPRIVGQFGFQTQTLYCAHGISSTLSFALNQNAALWGLAEFLVRKVPNAAKMRELASETTQTSAVDAVPPRVLDVISMIGFLARWAFRSLGHEIQKLLFTEQWLLVLRKRESACKLAEAYGFLKPPRDRFYADPFLLEREGHTYLFFEDYRFSSKKGLISCCEVDDAGKCAEPTVVLERPYHLSYPFLFEWRGEIYLMPETVANGAIELYRANGFPHSWVKEAVVMPRVSAVDSTLLFHQNRWWLFTAGVSANASPENTLLLFFSDSPLGPWTEHPKNPIVSDPRRARPAGNLYFWNGVLVRPGQDCSNGYGYAVQLSRVDVISETNYSETPLARISPSRFAGCHGTHTFNQSAKFQVMDAKFWIPRFQPFRFSRRRMVTIRGSADEESHFQADPHVIQPITASNSAEIAALKYEANLKN